MTKTQQLKPMGDVGAGLRFRLRSGSFCAPNFATTLRPFPTHIIAPAAGAKFGRILNDFVPMVGLSYEK